MSCQWPELPSYLLPAIYEPSLNRVMDDRFESKKPAQYTTITDVAQRSLEALPQTPLLNAGATIAPILSPSQPAYSFPASSSSSAVDAFSQLHPAIPKTNYVPPPSSAPSPAQPESKRVEYYVTPITSFSNITKCSNIKGKWTKKQRTIAMMKGLTMQQKVELIGKSANAIAQFLWQRNNNKESRRKKRFWSIEEKKIVTNPKYSVDQKMERLPGRSRHAIHLATGRFGNNYKPSKEA